MSWLFGQSANSSSNLKRLLGVYYDKRSSESFSHQQPPPHQQQLYEQAAQGTTTLREASFPQVSTQSPRERTGGSLESSSAEQVNDSEEEESELKIDKNLIWAILDDESLFNELKHQNNKLVDFICFGYVNNDSRPSGRDQDGDYDLVKDSESDTEATGTVEDDSSSATVKLSGSNQSTISVMEVLVELVVHSFKWFEKNESLLLKHSNDEEMDSQNDEEIDQVRELNAELKRIHVASEILSSDIWLISETLVEDQVLLTKLWRFLTFDLKNSSPSIPLFVKINERLLESRPDQLLNFIRCQPNLVDLFIKHIDIAIIMDLLLRIIATDRADIPTGIIDILSEQQLIHKLLNILQSEADTSVQSSCGDFLKAIISLSANTSIDENTIGPNLLTKQLVSDKSVDKIIEIILKRGNGLSTAVGVVIETIRKNNSDYDPVNLLSTTLESHPPSKRDPIYLGNLLRKFTKNLSKFSDILFNKEITERRIRNQINQEIEPLGFERFKICELIAELLHCSSIGLLNNHLTEKIIQEREEFLHQQEDHLASALNDEILDDPLNKSNQLLSLSNLNIGGTSEPSVAVNSKHILISPNANPNDSLKNGELPISDHVSGLEINNEEDYKFDARVNEVSKREQLRANPTIGDEFKMNLVDSKILKNIITMFTRFPWNNFWHNVVFDLVQLIFNGHLDIGYNSYLILELFEGCDITNLIIAAYELCVKTESEINVRLGYMGHLVLIAEEVVKFSSFFQNHKLNDAESDELIYNKLIDDNWISYVTNVLTETREQYNGVLGGIRTQDFEQSDHLNPNAIVLGQTEEEILNQPMDTTTSTEEEEETNDDVNKEL